jgi:UDPglucose--hexose-1-phosphate uridylyltransferase
MVYNELRKDYLLNRWVVIATERARRPSDFSKQKTEPAKTSVCPLCSGNEEMTPPAVLVYLQENGEIKKTIDKNGFRQKNWLIRVIPNLFPAFSPPEGIFDNNQIMRNAYFGNAIGNHEVIVESPVHDNHPSDSTVVQLINLVNAYKDRVRALSQESYVRYVQVFRNYGSEAGASLTHAHSQIIATPIIPTIVGNEIIASKEYYKLNGHCVFCDLIEREANTQRLIWDSDHFVTIAPYASVHPLEYWIIPKRHMSNILDLTIKETKALAQTLQQTLKALKELVNDPPYNYGIHLSIDKDTKDYYHWHIEVYPHLAIWAGFEKSTGMYINTVKPETAASELNKLIHS